MQLEARLSLLSAIPKGCDETRDVKSLGTLHNDTVIYGSLGWDKTVQSGPWLALGMGRTCSVTDRRPESLAV